jgi:hypothetical protein
MKNIKNYSPSFHGWCNIVPDTLFQYVDTTNYLSQSECVLSKSFVKPEFENELSFDFMVVIKEMMT